MKKKVISTMMAAAMAASLFTVPAFAEETTDEPVTITYWGWDSNYYQPMMDAYTELHPNVTFEATATEWGDMLTKAQQALASGSDLPTIIPMDITLIGNWKKTRNHREPS
jgi:multiple sugar transport system substrate-binding protein